MRTTDIFDLTVIGGGPTGMYAAYYAGLRELKTKVIEGLPILGGQTELLYPEKKITDIGAIPMIKGKDLVANLHQQMQTFQPEVHLEENVVEIDREDSIFTIRTDKGIHYSKTILLTTGPGAFEPRKLRFSYPKQYDETNLHYYVKSLDTYQDKRVVICGGGDSAVDWALMLKDVAKKVSLVHRRHRFRAHEASVSRLEKSSIEILTPYTPMDLLGDAERIDQVVLRKTRSDQIVHRPTDFLIVSFGFMSDSQQMGKWKIENKGGSAIVSQRMETSIPGIYAAGDAATFDGKVGLLATGFGEVPTAMNSIIRYLDL